MEASFLKTPEGLFDQAVEQVGITASKSTSDLGALLRHRVLEIEGSRVHTTDTYGRGGRKDAKWEFGEAAVGEVETPWSRSFGIKDLAPRYRQVFEE
jgi:hypothetical protein